MQKFTLKEVGDFEHLISKMKDVGGFLWCFVYLAYLYVGLTQGQINWPLVGSAINIGWELVYQTTSTADGKRVFANYFFALCHMMLLPFMIHNRTETLIYLACFAASYLIFKKFQEKRWLKYSIGLGLNIVIPFYLASLSSQCGSSLAVHSLKTLSNFLYAVAISWDPKIVNSSIHKYVLIGCFFVVFSEICSFASFLFFMQPCQQQTSFLL